MKAQNTTTDSVIVGKTAIHILDSTFIWFRSGCENYKPNLLAIENIKSKFKNCELIVFGGTWCDDTQHLLPPFYKVMQLAAIDKNKVTLYLLDKQKQSPAKTEVEYKITNIPTFILFNVGIEIGRITEQVKQSIEQDLADLLAQ